MAVSPVESPRRFATDGSCDDAHAHNQPRPAHKVQRTLLHHHAARTHLQESLRRGARPVGGWRSYAQERRRAIALTARLTCRCCCCCCRCCCCCWLGLGSRPKRRREAPRARRVRSRRAHAHAPRAITSLATHTAGGGRRGQPADALASARFAEAVSPQRQLNRVAIAPPAHQHKRLHHATAATPLHQATTAGVAPAAATSGTATSGTATSGTATAAAAASCRRGDNGGDDSGCACTWAWREPRRRARRSRRPP